MLDSILVVGHGTQSSLGASEFLRLVEKIARLRPRAIVEGCFLEMAEPRIGEALARVCERGGRRVVVAPLLLFAAAHAKDDIPELVGKAAMQLPPIELRQAEPLGCHARIVDLAVRRFQDALSRTPARQARDSLHLMVGRGSGDGSATAEMHRLAALCHERTGAGRLEVAFTDMAEPRVDLALERAASSQLPCIVVQPHLLFHGFLVERLAEQVSAARRRWRDKEWLLVERLGPDDAVVDALIERIDAASSFAVS